MKLIDRNEVLGIADYETIRDHFRQRVIGEKKLRRVALGPKATALFENRDTVLMQIQEMLRTERITREGAIAHEIETYNQFIPGELQLSCTIMIDVVDIGDRDAFLVAAEGFERHVALVIGGETFPARWDKARELQGRTSAVHYLKFALSSDGKERLVSAARPDATIAQVVLAVDHPVYSARVALPAETIVSLGEDLAADAPAAPQR